MPAPPIPHPLPYVELLAERAPETIDTVVLHCTELPDLATAREYGERVLYDSGTGNSGHYYIDRDGSTFEYVPVARVAHHTRADHRVHCTRQVRAVLLGGARGQHDDGVFLVRQVGDLGPAQVGQVAVGRVVAVQHERLS